MKVFTLFHSVLQEQFQGPHLLAVVKNKEIVDISNEAIFLIHTVNTQEMTAHMDIIILQRIIIMMTQKTVLLILRIFYYSHKIMYLLSLT